VVRGADNGLHQPRLTRTFTLVLISVFIDATADFEHALA
jgi:hypothetical protein